MRWLYMCLLMQMVSVWGSAPSILYLTWIDDPTSTMRIHWHAMKEGGSQVSYRLKGEGDWQRQEGASVKITGSKVRVHTVELKDLQADTEYEFDVDGSAYRFRTLPLDLSRPVRFVLGGDAYYFLGAFRQMNRRIAAQDPDFVVLGGDIAYTCGVPGWMGFKPVPMKRWHTFLREWKKTMVTSDGRLIPLLPVVGNHDVRMEGVQSRTFYELFAFPKQGVAFRVLDAGNYLSLFLLDSGHSRPIAGEQTEWLKQSLAERESMPYKFAAYHVAGYPACYSYTREVPMAIRMQWSPVFERYHLNAAFEHHNHAYKRTFPIKAGHIDPDGVVYMGDGSWGVHAREVKKMWYLSRAEKANAVNLVTLDKNRGVIEALQINGKVIDELQVLPMSALTACEDRRLSKR